MLYMMYLQQWDTWFLFPEKGIVKQKNQAWLFA